MSTGCTHAIYGKVILNITTISYDVGSQNYSMIHSSLKEIKYGPIQKSQS